jgi:hypothetical protein
MAETKELVNCLTDEKVFVKFIMDTKNGITDKTHPLYGGLSTNASIGIPAPILNKRIAAIFSKEELAFLGAELNEDLSPNSSFWKEFRKDPNGMMVDGFPIFLKKEGAMFNKKDPMDYIKIKILQDSDLIANSFDEIKDRQGVRFYLVSEKDIYKKEIVNISTKQKAVKLFGKYEDNAEVLKYVLKSFNKSIDQRHSIEFLQKEVWKISEDHSIPFISTLEDPNLGTKIKINDFLNFNLINKSNGLFYDLNGNKLSLDGEVNDLTGCARYLDSGIGGEFRLECEAKVKALSNTKK